ncbi:ATP-binding protein [Streptomyces kronopolitis]|uniref:ATP-binding protein n=1 Tax=Streptomyces kronopolitis TaxID=1612435 RepID=A0ABQ2IVN5_9ACTN|nr:ATP-binding protein [Streptomyces kronopolitis]GGN32290.1 ATP-binding protein [Streptomyces kronopolitis]
MQHRLAIDDHPSPQVQRACQPDSAAQARDFARGFAALLCPEPSALTTQNLLLLVSELVANALRHAGAVTALRLRADRERIEVCVEDPSPTPPQERRPDLTGSHGGFGWPMVHTLAVEVAVLPGTGGGKTVQAVLAR